MIDTSNARKVVKRFISFISDIASNDDPEYRRSRLTELAEFMDSNMPVLEEVQDPDLSNEIKNLMERLSSSNYELPEEILKLLETADPENTSIRDYHATMLYRKEEFEEAIRTITADPAYCNSDASMDVLKDSSLKAGVLRPVVVFYAGCGKYDEELFSAYLEKDATDEINDKVLENYSEKGEYDLSTMFLTSLIKAHPSNAYRIELVKAYRKLGNNEAMKESLDTIDIISIENNDLLLEVAQTYEFLDDPANALNAASMGLRKSPGDTGFLRIKARSLLKLDRKEESLEAFERLSEKVPSDVEAIRNSADLSYYLEKYQDSLKYLNLLGEIDEYTLDDLLKSIDTKIRLSMFDEAKRDVIKALEKDENNIEVLKYKFKLERLLHDENDAYNTAVRILEINPGEHDCLRYRMDYLYEMGENQAFLEGFDRIAEDEIKQEYVPKKISCLINSDRFEDAASAFLQNPELLNRDEVLDALFFNMRTDDEIKTVIDAVQKSSYKEFPLLMLVLYKIQGKRCVIDQDVLDALGSCSSSAIAHIIAMESIDFNSKSIPDFTKHMLSRTKFKQTRDLVDVIFDIYTGKFNEDIQDSPDLLYPISNSLILNGSYDGARYSLRKSRDSRKTDPFYYYYEALIDYYKGETGGARKNLAKASDELTNVLFLGLDLRIDISEGAENDVLETIGRILDMKEPQAINFRIIHNYIVQNEKYEFASSLIEVLSGYGVDNIWVKRILRDYYLHQRNFEKAEEVSARIVDEPSITLDDVKTHSGILERNGKEEKRVSFLMEAGKKVEDPLIDRWLGDYFYGRNDYDSALEYYRKALSKNMEPLSIENYIDSLIETENYEEAEKLIKKLPEGGGILLVKLYHRTGNIQRIVDLIRNLEIRTKDEEEQISYISRILWMNREVRDALVGIYESEGYLFLGKVLAQRMMDSQDYRKAIDIMRNVQKNYPDDVENIENLADSLAKTGQINDAIEVLNRALKQVKDPRTGMEIITRLMRLYFEDGDYPAVIKYYESNRDYVDETSLQYIIRSYLAVRDFDAADKLLGKYEGTLLGKDVHRELQEELSSKREFQEILRYVVRMLKLEYKAGKKFDMNEALYRADIPIEMIEKVFEFLRSDEYYVDINEEKYELLSRDVLQSVVKRSKVSGIDDVNISIIFNNLDSKDPVVAKNLYIYIRRSLEKERGARVHDETLERLLKIALREKVPPEPLRIAYALNIGISEAMDVITLMNYMARLNRQGDL